MDRERKMSGGTRLTKIVEAIRFMLTNYRHMAISCSRTATHTTSWVARASRCPVDPWENKNRSNGGITSWQPRRKPPRKRNTKRIMLVQKFPKASREKHLLRGFSGAVHAQPLFLRRWALSSAAGHQIGRASC